MQKRMIADMAFPYDGKDVKAGDEFLANEKDVFALEVYRRAHVEGKEEPRKKRQYNRRDMTAENP